VVRVPVGQLHMSLADGRYRVRSEPPVQQHCLAQAGRPPLFALDLGDEAEVPEREGNRPDIRHAGRLLWGFEDDPHPPAPARPENFCLDQLPARRLELRSIESTQVGGRACSRWKVRRDREEVQSEAVTPGSEPHADLAPAWLTAGLIPGGVEADGVQRGRCIAARTLLEKSEHTMPS